MHHTKKIGVFLSHVYGDYQTRLLRGISAKAAKYGYRIEIFATNDGEDFGDYGLGDTSILEIPKPGNFDGFVLASGTYLLPSLRQDIVRRLRVEFQCPVIDIFQMDSPFVKVILDNDSPVKDLVLHLAKVHGYQKFCYLGNSNEAYFNNRRVAYFEEGLRELSLWNEEQLVFSTDCRRSSIRNILETLKQQNKLPDVFLCYNDNVALDTINLLREMNLQVPDDIAVTGQDTLKFGQQTTPVLTSIAFPIGELGEKAIDLLHTIFIGESIPDVSVITAKPCIGTSCGCTDIPLPDTYAYADELYQQIASMESRLILQMHMAANLLSVDNLDRGMDLVAEFTKKIPGCRDVFVCLYDGWDQVSGHIRELTHTDQEVYNSDTVLLKLAMRRGERLPECTFPRGCTLPENLYDDGSNYYYAPLSFGTQHFGYLALAFESGTMGYDFSFISWLMNINSLLKGLCDKKDMKLMVSHLESIYTIDELTGLLNRQGFNRSAATMFEQAIENHETIAAMMLDLDCLKKINDTFGHDEGDFAIQVLARALEDSVTENCICSRHGGDEFQILVKGCDDMEAKQLVSRIHKYLEHYNKTSPKGYCIQASVGYSIRIPSSPIEISEMFSLADQAMYKVKKHKKKEIIKG